MKPANREVYAQAENNANSLWEIPSGRLLHNFNGHADAVWGLAVGTTGDWIVSGGRDRTLRMWQLP